MKNEFINLLEFLIDNIFVEFRGYIFYKPSPGAPLLGDIFLYYDQAEFVQKLIKDRKKIQKLKPLILYSGI